MCAIKLSSDAGHVLTLDMQVGEGVSMHCEMYYITRLTYIFRPIFKDNTIYRLSFIIYYATNIYSLNS